MFNLEINKFKEYNVNVKLFFFLLLPPVEFSSRVSSGIKWFQPSPDCSFGDQTVVIPTKFSVNHH
jgi:hypothetical protein